MASDDPNVGKVWSPKPETKRPRGRPPKNMMWNEKIQKYVDLEGNVDEDFERNRMEKRQKRKEQAQERLRALEAQGSLEAELLGKKPQGRPPKGMKWDPSLGKYVSESGEIHESPIRGPSTPIRVTQNRNGTFRRPRGRTPKGMVWDENTGEWKSPLILADSPSVNIASISFLSDS